MYNIRSFIENFLGGLNMSMSFEMYMHDVIAPMRSELTNLGITELRTPEEVVEQDNPMLRGLH